MAHNLTVEYSMLLALATKAQKNAHAPYSNFHVGAAILDENAQHHGGCNVENAAYPLGQCAEAGAISAMIASGGKQIKQNLICLVVFSEYFTIHTVLAGCLQALQLVVQVGLVGLDWAVVEINKALGVCLPRGEPRAIQRP